MLRLVKSEININSLLFYEGGIAKPNKSKKYQSQFFIDQTRFIYGDLILTYPKVNKTRFVNLEYVYQAQDGIILDKKNLKIELKEGTSTFTLTFRNGLDKFHQWNLGEYKVNIFLDGKKIAVESFLIVESKDNFLDKVKADSILLFQSSFINLTEREKREYKTQFPQLETGRIACEIDLSYKTLEMDRRVIIEQVIYYSDGELLAREYYEEKLLKGSNSSKSEMKWGYGKKGQWLCGKYRMEILLNGKILGAKEFEVINKDVLVLPTLTFDSIHFYNSEYNGVDKKNRVYKRKFTRETASYIFWEIRLSMTTIPERRRIKVEFVYLRPDKSELANERTFFYLERGWCDAWYSHGWGYSDLGNWQKGLYTVKIKIDGKNFCDGQFEIVD